MGNKDQNMDNGYEKLIKDLKNLPKVDAPADFEYKLMTKIQNGQFGDNEIKKETGKLWRFIPATAMALSAIIIFFVVQETSVEPENPYLNNSEQTNVAESRSADKPARTLNNDYIANQPNDVSRKQNNTAKPRLKGVGVDGFIDGKLKSQNSDPRSHIVGNNNRFDGFLVDKDRKEVEALRARLDSIKAAEKKRKEQK